MDWPGWQSALGAIFRVFTNRIPHPIAFYPYPS